MVCRDCFESGRRSCVVEQHSEIRCAHEIREECERRPVVWQRAVKEVAHPDGDDLPGLREFREQSGRERMNGTEAEVLWVQGFVQASQP